MRPSLLLFAVLWTSAAAAQDGGPADAGSAPPISRAVNQALGVVQGHHRALVQASDAMMAQGKSWRDHGPQKGSEKKFGRQQLEASALETKHQALVAKHAEIVNRLEKLAQDHANQAIDAKKTATMLTTLQREDEKLTAEHAALAEKHAGIVGHPSADAGMVDGGPADAGSVVEAPTDAGAADGGAVDAGFVGPDAGSSVSVSGVVSDAGSPAAPPPAKSCAATGGLAWAALSALWLVRRWRGR